jgi:hypothetical protein
MRGTNYCVILLLWCSPLIAKVLRILKALWQTWMQGSLITKMPHRDLSVASQVGPRAFFMPILIDDRFLQELFRQCHSSIRRTLAFEAEVRTDLNLRLTALERQVNRVQKSQGIHGQVLHISAKELGILRAELENSRLDTHQLKQTCNSFWHTMVNEMEDIRTGIINETNSLEPCPGNDLHDEILRSDRVYCALHISYPHTNDM